MNGPFSEIQHPKKRAFLIAYAETGKKGLAAELAGIDRSAIYQPGWRDDPEFQEALKYAREMAADILEEEVIRRAVEGVEEPVGWYKGKPGGTITRYSDNLLMFQLKSLRPDLYRDRVDVNAMGILGRLDLNKLPDDLIARLADGEHPASVLAGVLKEAAEQLPMLGAGQGDAVSVAAGDE